RPCTTLPGPADPFVFGTDRPIKVDPKGDHTFAKTDSLWYFYSVENPALPASAPADPSAATAPTPAGRRAAAPAPPRAAPPAPRGRRPETPRDDPDQRPARWPGCVRAVHRAGRARPDVSGRLQHG